MASVEGLSLYMSEIFPIQPPLLVLHIIKMCADKLNKPLQIKEG